MTSQGQGTAAQPRMHQNGDGSAGLGPPNTQCPIYDFLLTPTPTPTYKTHASTLVLDCGAKCGLQGA